MKWTIGEIADWVDGRLIADDDGLPLEHVAVDSRQLMEPGTIFVALKGPRFDGHDFVGDALKKGAAAAIVERDNHDFLGELEAGDEKALIVVDDTLDALQAFAAAWRARFSIPVVAVTGSNGKTIVKDMLASILGNDKTVYRSPGSFNSQVGVALALLGIDREHQVAIIEAGISQTGEMERLRAMIEPTMGIVTNIGLAHAAGLGDEETTAREKRKLFRHMQGPVVVPANEPLLGKDELFHVKRWTVAAADDPQHIADQSKVAVTNLRTDDEQGFVFELRFPDDETVDITLEIPGRHNVVNAAMAAAMARILGADEDAIVRGLEVYSLREMRLEMHTTGADITLINDAYNADPTSVRAALAVLDNYAGRQRRVAILGDMLDLGTRAERAHRDVGAHAAHLELDRLFCVGDLARFIGEGAKNAGMNPDSIECVDDFETLHLRLEEELQPRDVVLFKASRSIGLERAARRLIESVAPTRLHIDLNAIGDNFHALRRHLGNDVSVMAVVKSFGYGNDASRIAQTLIQHGVDALAVAFPDEAIPLRNKGLTIPILVTNARAEEADKLVKYDLEPLVYTPIVARALARQAALRNKRIGIHLAVDTGMRRAGLRPNEVVDFAHSLEDHSALEIQGLMTHFAVADSPGEDDFTRAQIEQFTTVRDDLRAAGIDPPVVHAANTAAAWRFPTAHFDMVRVGLGIYGLHPSKGVKEAIEGQSDQSVRPALRMSTRILHLQQVDAGETVGYGRSWRADSPRRLATLAAGYNDGFPYFLSNCGEVLINGRRCPVVGSVCMDVTVVDATDAGEVSVGDEAVLFGHQGDGFIDIDEWAALGDTINYELLCNISPRVRRIFSK